MHYIIRYGPEQMIGRIHFTRTLTKGCTVITSFQNQILRWIMDWIDPMGRSCGNLLRESNGCINGMEDGIVI